MKKFLMALALIFMCFVSISMPSFAVEQAAIDKAVSMALEAKKLIEQVGASEAFDQINAGNKWKDGEHYVLIMDAEGNCVADAAVPAMTGKNFINVRDVNGKTFIKDVLAVQGTGWVDYFWINPMTKQVASKHVYVVQTGNYHIMSGVYR